MRGLAIAVLLLGCARPSPAAAPRQLAEPVEPQAPSEQVTIEHDEERIEQLGRELYEERRRRAELEELRAKIRAGKIVCTPTNNRIHGPSAICTEKP
ncbi:MAG TPA: hypothetical protein VM513_22970 [Kofleriaceae bacterium]|jgi:hypothetical protein|nr:hypothetical protein [Kofleriaceae bacterium]